MALDDIPRVDLADWRDGTASGAVDHALRTSGFLLLGGHGVPAQLAVDLRAQALELFHADASLKACYETPVGRPGWSGLRTEANAYASGGATPPDLKETLVFVPAAGTVLVEPAGEFHATNDVFSGDLLVSTATAYIDAVHALARELLGLLSATLGDDDGVLLAGTDRVMSSLNVSWYPNLEHVGDVEPDQFRIGPHADFGTITVLDRENGVGCLQVQRTDGSWVDAPHDPDALTINIGDLMAQWTGGRWRSSTHRVLPPSPDAPTEELVSLVYFVESNVDAVIAPFPPPIGGGEVHAPVEGGEWLRRKMDAITV